MTKIAITADIHLGVPRRLDDIIWACKVTREYCRTTGIDVVLVLGDLFHDRRYIEIDVLNAACDFFTATKQDYNQDWITFPGNHDMYLRHSWDITSIKALHKHMMILNGVKLLTVDDQRFWIVPFISRERSYMKVINMVSRMALPNDILLTHIGVNGAEYNTCFLLKDWNMVTFETTNFKRIYTGHFHTKQQVGSKTWYPGSLIPFKFDEGDVPHGFFVLDTDTGEHKFINIWKAGKMFFPNTTLPPQFMTILDESVDSKSPDEIGNNNIRVALQHEYTMEQKKQIKAKLMDLGARSVYWLQINKDESPQQLKQLISQNQYKDLFQEWVRLDKNGVKDLQLDLLKRMNEEITFEGDELYYQEESEIIL